MAWCSEESTEKHLPYIIIIIIIIIIITTTTTTQKWAQALFR
jgi:hypothetical protein